MNVQLACLIRIRIFRYTLPLIFFILRKFLFLQIGKQLHLFVVSNAEVSTVDS